MNPNLVTLRVWGDFACFSRPEMKVERVSYEVPTPSAARGILESIFWEPQMYYLIDSIRIVKPGAWFSFRRNEVTRVVSIDSAKTWMKEPEKAKPILAGGGAEDCTQRNMLARQNVEYLITAEVRLTHLARPPRDNLGKYTDEIRRRARSGKCFHRPGLGMREFAADFELVEEDPDAFLASRLASLPDDEKAPPMQQKLGLMLYDIFDHRQRDRGFRWFSPEEQSVSDASFEESLKPLMTREANQRRKTRVVSRHEGNIIRPAPAFFQAEVKAGVMDCHPDRIRIISPAQP